MAPPSAAPPAPVPNAEEIVSSQPIHVSPWEASLVARVYGVWGDGVSMQLWLA
jgi:hypothetical protein